MEITQPGASNTFAATVLLRSPNGTEGSVELPTRGDSVELRSVTSGESVLHIHMFLITSSHDSLGLFCIQSFTCALQRSTKRHAAPVSTLAASFEVARCRRTVSLFSVTDLEQLKPEFGGHRTSLALP